MLRDDEINRIQQMWATGRYSKAEIARRVGRGKDSVMRILKGQGGRLPQRARQPSSEAMHNKSHLGTYRCGGCGGRVMQGQECLHCKIEGMPTVPPLQVVPQPVTLRGFAAG